MRKIAFFVIGMCCAMMASARVVTYTPDDVTEFRNPERGFTEELSYKVTDNHPNVVKGNISSSWGDSEKRSLVMVLYNFKNFKTKDLSNKVLAGFDEDMAELRQYGLKCVLRFAYTEDINDKNDATPEWVKRHLEQLKPHLAANADVIYVIEAGFIGVWGEWYYTTHYGNESQHMNANRRKVIQYLFENVPENRFVLFRYPMIKTEYLNDETPLTSAEGFSGTVKARMGCHNDAFLNEWGNDGTYASDDKSDDPAVRRYVAQETLYVPNGGETNVESSTLANKVAQYDTTMAELKRYHWSFCGSSYSTKVTNKWRQNGAFTEMVRKLGYRYQLVNATLPDSARAGGAARFQFKIRNVGFAPLYNERHAYIVLKAPRAEYRIQIGSDPRRWEPNGAEAQINEVLTIPAEVPDGTYELYLYLPDAAESLANDSRYAIRFANENVWDETTGMNRLNASLIIDKNAPEVVEAVENVAWKAESEKILRNGRLLILRGNEVYDVLGNKQ